MTLGELVSEDLINADLQGKNKQEVVEELLELLVKAGKVEARNTALNDLMEREQYLSTGLENGLAVPHAKTAAAPELMVSFGLNRKGLDFDSLDGHPAHFIFLVLSPRDTSGPHIKTLAQITRNFREGEVGQQILNAPDSAAIYEIIQNFK